MADDRLRAALLGIIRDATRRVDYLRHVRARVVHVLADGRVDVMPETVGTPQQQALPLRYGVPGVLRAVCRAGARAVIAWAEGDPSQPFVAGWEAGALEELVFDVDGGARPLARSDDATADGAIVFSAASGVLTITYTPPGGGTPQTVTLGIAGVTGGGTITLSGRITGTSKVQA